jgi:hypothetical protein
MARAGRGRRAFKVQSFDPVILEYGCRQVGHPPLADPWLSAFGFFAGAAVVRAGLSETRQVKRRREGKSVARPLLNGGYLVSLDPLTN